MIYRATSKDLDFVATLATRLWPWHTKEEMLARYEGLLSSDECAVYLYEEGEYGGYAHCQLRHDYVEGTTTSPVGYLEGIYVDSECRGKGLARDLLKMCEDWAKEKGCTEFASDCELSDILSSRFHTKAGFKVANRIICFKKTLE